MSKEEFRRIAAQEFRSQPVSSDTEQGSEMLLAYAQAVEDQKPRNWLDKLWQGVHFLGHRKSPETGVDAERAKKALQQVRGKFYELDVEDEF